MSKAKLKLRIFLMCIVFVSIYSHLEANDSCTTPSYPDQEPFDSCINDESLLWEENSPVEEMGPDSSASIYFKGGRSPYTVSIYGNKIYLDSQGTTQKITINNTSATIYTIGACGSAVITVTDDCGNRLDGSIRSTNGKWVLTAQGDINTAIPCPFMAPLADWKKLTSGDYELIRGRIKLINNIWPSGGSGACDYEGNSYPICGSAWVDKSCWPYAASFCVSDIIDKMVEGNHPGFEGEINVIGGCVNYNGRDSECFGGSGLVCGIYQVRGILSIYEWKCHGE